MADTERPVDMPDTSETYERAHPGKEPGGQLEANERVPDERADSVQGSTRNDDEQPALAGQDPQSAADSVDPESDLAHAGRADAAKVENADDAGLAPQETPHGKDGAA